MRGARLGIGLLGGLVLLTAGCDVTRTFAQGDGGAGGGTTTTASSPTTSTSAGGASGSGGSTTNGTGGAPPSCGTGLVCVPETPSGWQGPFAVYTGDGAVGTPFCPTTYAQVLGDYFADLDPGVADCGCTCGAATGVTCSSTAYLCNVSDCLLAIACTNLNADQTLTAGPSCVASNPGAKVTVGGGGVTNAGSCAAMTNPTIPPPTWGTAAKVCGGATTTTVGCDAGEICAPAGDTQFDKLCIVQPGEVACTDPFYSVQHVVYEDETDSRSCSGVCGCGAATSTCTGHVDFNHSSCMLNDSTVAVGGCAAVAAVASEASFGQPVGSGTCAPTGSAVTGGVTPTGALTLCCDG
jgi:hypothetical protein